MEAGSCSRKKTSDTAVEIVTDSAVGVASIKIYGDTAVTKKSGSSGSAVSSATGLINGIGGPPGADTAAVYHNGTIVMDLENNLLLRMSNIASEEDLYKDFADKVFIIALLLLCLSVLGAVLFAGGITRPIKTLAGDTRKMASLEIVSPPAYRRDEVGQLARDVHSMYQKLKQTISELENEIKREREMEENQRYFFSAASHELKTPIAASSALLEGMIAGVGDYKNHHRYLKECLNMMHVQNRIITEILKIVNLSDERMVPCKEDIQLLSVINSLLPEYRTLAERRGQRILINVPETVLCHTDQVMIRNVLSNVMMNAIQNSPEGEEIRVRCEEDKDAGIVHLSIINTNAHIEEGIRARLFEPFFRADKSRSRSEGRSGLGLAIVKKILDTLAIPFELDTQGSDVVFRLEIPAAVNG